MSLLKEQQQRALEAMREFLAAPPGSDGQTPVQAGEVCDRERVRLIEHDLKPLLLGYLEEKISLPDFKSRVDSINKRNSGLWGF